MNSLKKIPPKNLNIKHIKRRFKERFQNVNSWSGKEIKFLRNIDVLEISDIALSPKGYMTHEVKGKGTKKIIFFSGISMWCVIRKGVLRTIYPVSKNEIKELYMLTENERPDTNSNS